MIYTYIYIYTLYILYIVPIYLSSPQITPKHPPKGPSKGSLQKRPWTQSAWTEGCFIRLHSLTRVVAVLGVFSDLGFRV